MPATREDVQASVSNLLPSALSSERKLDTDGLNARFLETTEALVYSLVVDPDAPYYLAYLINSILLEGLRSILSEGQGLLNVLNAEEVEAPEPKLDRAFDRASDAMDRISQATSTGASPDARDWDEFVNQSRKFAKGQLAPSNKAITKDKLREAYNSAIQSIEGELLGVQARLSVLNPEGFFVDDLPDILAKAPQIGLSVARIRETVSSQKSLLESGSKSDRTLNSNRMISDTASMISIARILKSVGYLRTRGRVSGQAYPSNLGGATSARIVGDVNIKTVVGNDLVSVVLDGETLVLDIDLVDENVPSANDQEITFDTLTKPSDLDITVGPIGYGDSIGLSVDVVEDGVSHRYSTFFSLVKSTTIKLTVSDAEVDFTAGTIESVSNPFIGVAIGDTVEIVGSVAGNDGVYTVDAVNGIGSVSVTGLTADETGLTIHIVPSTASDGDFYYSSTLDDIYELSSGLWSISTPDYTDLAAALPSQPFGDDVGGDPRVVSDILTVTAVPSDTVRFSLIESPVWGPTSWRYKGPDIRILASGTGGIGSGSSVGTGQTLQEIVDSINDSPVAISASILSGNRLAISSDLNGVFAGVGSALKVESQPLNDDGVTETFGLPTDLAYGSTSSFSVTEDLVDASVRKGMVAVLSTPIDGDIVSNLVSVSENGFIINDSVRSDPRESSYTLYAVGAYNYLSNVSGNLTSISNAEDRLLDSVEELSKVLSGALFSKAGKERSRRFVQSKIIDPCTELISLYSQFVAPESTSVTSSINSMRERGFDLSVDYLLLGDVASALALSDKSYSNNLREIVDSLGLTR